MLGNLGLSAVENEKRKSEDEFLPLPSSPLTSPRPQATMAAVLSPTKPTASDTSSLTQDDPSFALVAAMLTEEIQALSDARVAQRLQASYTSSQNAEQRGGTAPDIDLTDDSDGELESDQIASLQKQLDFLIESGLSKGSIGGQGVNERKRDRLEESDDEGVPGKVQKLMVRISHFVEPLNER